MEVPPGPDQLAPPEVIRLSVGSFWPGVVAEAKPVPLTQSASAEAAEAQLASGRLAPALQQSQAEAQVHPQQLRSLEPEAKVHPHHPEDLLNTAVAEAAEPVSRRPPVISVALRCVVAEAEVAVAA